MNTEQLASAIFDAQPANLSTDELIAISSIPDCRLIRAHYANPQNGADLLLDFSDCELDTLFATCESLEDATAKVAQLSSEQPLSADESNYVRNHVLRATIEATMDIAEQRKLQGFPLQHLTPIVTMIVCDLRKFVGNFTLNGKQL